MEKTFKIVMLGLFLIPAALLGQMAHDAVYSPEPIKVNCEETVNNETTVVEVCEKRIPEIWERLLPVIALGTVALIIFTIAAVGLFYAE